MIRRGFKAIKVSLDGLVNRLTEGYLIKPSISIKKIKIFVLSLKCQANEGFTLLKFDRYGLCYHMLTPFKAILSITKLQTHNLGNNNCTVVSKLAKNNVYKK